MYFAPNVRASLGDHVTRFARSAQKFIFWVEEVKRFVKRRMKKKYITKNYITRLQGE